MLFVPIAQFVETLLKCFDNISDRISKDEILEIEWRWVKKFNLKEEKEEELAKYLQLIAKNKYIEEVVFEKDEKYRLRTHTNPVKYKGVRKRLLHQESVCNGEIILTISAEKDIFVSEIKQTIDEYHVKHHKINSVSRTSYVDNPNEQPWCTLDVTESTPVFMKFPDDAEDVDKEFYIDDIDAIKNTRKTYRSIELEMLSWRKLENVTKEEIKKAYKLVQDLHKCLT
jgi:hypothetical protein